MPSQQKMPSQKKAWKSIFFFQSNFIDTLNRFKKKIKLYYLIYSSCYFKLQNV